MQSHGWIRRNRRSSSRRTNLESTIDCNGGSSKIESIKDEDIANVVQDALRREEKGEKGQLLRGKITDRQKLNGSSLVG